MAHRVNSVEPSQADSISLIGSDQSKSSSGRIGFGLIRPDSIANGLDQFQYPISCEFKPDC